MKFANKIFATSAFVAMTVCSACGTLFGPTKSSSSGSTDSSSSSSSSSQKVQQDAVLPHDREQISSKSNIKAYTPDDIKNGVIQGDWAIETVNGKNAVGEKAPFLKFVPSEMMVYGNNGCNVLNGSYTCNPADSTLSFGEMAATMMLCNKEGITDIEINVALSMVKSYSCVVNGSNYYLRLYDAGRNEVMTLLHQDFDFLNGTWLVKQIDDQKVNDPEMKMVIDVDEGKIHGNTGCNIYNGSFEIDMESPNSISFSAIAMTRMACPDKNYETQLVVALEEASKATPISDNEVRLFDSQGSQVLQLVRTSDK